MSQGLSSANSSTTKRLAWRREKRERESYSISWIPEYKYSRSHFSLEISSLYSYTLWDGFLFFAVQKEFWKYTVWILEELTLIYQKYQSAILHINNFLRTILYWKKYIYKYINTEYFPIFRSLVLIAGLKFVEWDQTFLHSGQHINIEVRWLILIFKYTSEAEEATWVKNPKKVNTITKTKTTDMLRISKGVNQGKCLTKLLDTSPWQHP